MMMTRAQTCVMDNETFFASQKMMNFFLTFSTSFFLVVVQAKCLDKCQFIPSFEWREQCNTCLEIPWYALVGVLFLSRFSYARAQSVCLCFFFSLVLSKTYVLPAYFFFLSKQFQVVFFYGVHIRRHRTRMRFVLRRVRQSARVRAKAVRKIRFGICPDTVRRESWVSRARLMCPIVITECIFVQVFYPNLLIYYV